jgi:hypothetical protein
MITPGSRQMSGRRLYKDGRRSKVRLEGWASLVMIVEIP